LGSQEESEGILDALTARTATQPKSFSNWTHTVILQLSLQRPLGALRTLERARSIEWSPEKCAQLDFLKAAAEVAVEPLEDDALIGEEHLDRAQTILRRLHSRPDMELPASFGLAWISCEMGHPSAARELLESKTDLPPRAAQRLWEAMVRACGSTMDSWLPHFERARAENDRAKLSAAARLAPGPYLLYLQQALDAPIEEGLSLGRGGRAVDFSAVDSLLKRVEPPFPGAYSGVRARMQTIRGLDGHEGLRALSLVRALHRFDATFADKELVWQRRCELAVKLSEGRADSCEALRLWYLAGRWHWGRGFAQAQLGRPLEQVKEYEAALEAAKRLTDAAYLSKTAFNLFMVCDETAKQAQRLELLPMLVKLAEQKGVSVAEVAVAEGRAYEDLGDLEKAWRITTNAYRESRRHGAPYTQITALSNLAWLALRRNENETASRYAREILARTRPEDLPPRLPSYGEAILAMRTWAMLDLGKALPPNDPERLKWYESAESSARGQEQYAQLLHIRLARAEEYLDENDLSAATKTLASARTLALRHDYEYGLWRVDALQARCEKLAGDYQAAARSYDAALRGLEGISEHINNAEHRAGFLLPASRVFQDAITLLRGPLHDPSTAYSVDERARARALLQKVSGKVSGSQLRSADEVCSSLRDDQVLLQYRVHEDGIDLWILSSTGIRFEEIAQKESELQENIQRWRTEIERGFTSSLGAKLGSLLLTPAAGELAVSDQVVVVADQPLSRVPFALLRLDGEYLLQRHAVSCELSGSIRCALMERKPLGPKEGVLAVGYGGGRAAQTLHLRELPFVESEASLVAGLASSSRLLLGEHATADSVAALLPEAGILHLAAHAGLDAFGEPFLLLAPRKDGDGLVHGEQLSAWPLNKVSLVTLAGCETARLGSSEVEGDLSSLGVSVFAGGSRDLIASLWSVGDDSTMRLMALFYRELFESRRPPIQALRHAQLELAGSDGALEREWGAFCFFGP
jgi:CHAT domain-containing protein